MRPRFFSKYEWWYHLSIMPVLLAIGNYYFIGWLYFTNISVWIRGTLLSLLLYGASVVLLTLAIRRVIRWFPLISQTQWRVLSMLFVTVPLTVTLAIVDVKAYELMLNIPFSWETVQAISLVGTVFDLFLSIIVGLFYLFERWKVNEWETQQLSRLSMQYQFDRLKNQVNPHFLFTSLDTLSKLIRQDPDQAERFVTGLSRVYRYLLLASKTNVVTLSSELEFTRTYVHLLNLRYGKVLPLSVPLAGTLESFLLPPLTLQRLIDDAIQENDPTVYSFLSLEIKLQADSRTLTFKHQRNADSPLPAREGFQALLASYEFLQAEIPQAEETPKQFAVSIPLLEPAS